MKTHLKSLLLVIVPVVLMGCGSTETGPSAAPQKTAAVTRSSEEKPQVRIGMTKAQVIRAWGDPSAKDITGRGEIWVWGNENWKRSIPYAGPFLHVQTSKVLFGTDGLVKDFRLTDKGDVMSDMEGHSAGFNPW